MQTEQQHLRIFSYGRHVLLWLSFVLTATLCPAQMLEVDVYPPDTQQLLDREKSLLEEPVAVIDNSPILLEHEQILLAESSEKICIPAPKEIIEAPPLAAPICTYNAFVYPPQRRFQSNPLTSQKITLPNLPYQLTPFGTPPRKKQVVAHKPVVKPAQPTAAEIAKKEAEEKEALKQESEIVAMSPFLAWVKANKEKAAETAKENAQKYRKEPPRNAEEASSDLFMSIRFPYKGTEPAGNSVAIYSTPEK